MPGLTVLRLSGHSYAEHVVVEGSAIYTTQDPFPIEVVPADLVT